MTGTLTAVLVQAGPMGPMGGGYGPMGGGYGPMHGWGTMGMGTGWWGALTLLVVVVLAVGALVLLTQRGAFDGGDDALTELRRAYARGDLSDEEYERRRARLS